MLTTIYEQVLGKAQNAWARYKDRRALGGLANVEPAALRLHGPITRQEFHAVKVSLRLVGKARGYESVKAVAKMHGIGRSTAYRIKAAKSWAEYQGIMPMTIKVRADSRAHKVKVHTH